MHFHVIKSFFLNASIFIGWSQLAEQGVDASQALMKLKLLLLNPPLYRSHINVNNFICVSCSKQLISGIFALLSITFFPQAFLKLSMENTIKHSSLVQYLFSYFQITLTNKLWDYLFFWYMFTSTFVFPFLGNCRVKNSKK